MKMERIVEVGIAVKDLEATSKKYVEVLGATPSEIIAVDQYGDRCQMCRIADVDLRLMEPTIDNETAKLIEKRQGRDWLSYIGLKVPNINEAIAWMGKNNIKMIDETPREEDGVRFAFVHPDSFRGVTFKLIEGEHKQRYLPQPPAHKAIPTPARVKRLYHIGVNVTNIEAPTRLYTEVLGTSPTPIRINKVYDMSVTMNYVGDIPFELICPLSEDGTIGRSVAKIGEGLAHLAVLVPDLQAAVDWMTQSGIRVIDPPRKPPRAVFTHPVGFNGVMFEFIPG